MLTNLPFIFFAFIATSFPIICRLHFFEVQHALGANDDVLIHIHNRRNKHSSQDSYEKVIGIESQMGFPALVERLISCHIVFSHIWFACNQKAWLLISIWVVYILIFQEIIGNIITHELQISLPIWHFVKEIYGYAVSNVKDN